VHVHDHDEDKPQKTIKSPGRSKAAKPKPKHSAPTAAASGGGGGGGSEVAMTTAGRSTHFWRDWHTLKVVKRPRGMFGGRGSKNRNSAIEQKPLL
jgi:hypothetical protein